MSILRKLFLRATKEYPMAIEMMQVSLIMGSGDVLAQTIAEKKKLATLDWPRTARFAALGLVFVGPSLRMWYGTLERVVDKNQHPLTRTLKKVALDQCCFAPVFTLAITSVVSIVNGLGVEGTKDQVRRNYLPILKMNYMLWPAVQLLNFGLVPLQYQVLFQQFVSLFWNMYLSLKLNQPAKT